MFDPAPAESPEETIMASMSRVAGTMLAGVLSAFVESGNTLQSKAYILGPAGSVMKLTILVEPVQTMPGNA